jgi:4-hydroxy-3-methylbut-2-en-1-yl diphosphate synthase IspG/GcpE
MWPYSYSCLDASGVKGINELKIFKKDQGFDEKLQDLEKKHFQPDLLPFATMLELPSFGKFLDRHTPIKAAVMGCVVNGPGEAKDADVGIACGKGKGAMFRNGKVVGTVSEQNLLEALMAEVNSFDERKSE